MIVPFRIALILIAVLFTYFFGDTLENFLLDVIRFLIPVRESNAILFNFFHTLAYLTPLYLLGGIISATLGGEEPLKKNVWTLIIGGSLGIFAFRIYQLWWVLRGGALAPDNAIESWTESLTHTQLYCFEKIFPYLIIGLVTGLTTSFMNKNHPKVHYMSVIASASTFLWLAITQKIQNLAGFFQGLTALLVTSLAGLCIGLFFLKLKKITDPPQDSQPPQTP